jgi:hypothetical protein
MNRKNLQRMAEYIRSIPQNRFDMSVFREDDKDNGHECQSVGCAIGHCTALDTRPLPKDLGNSILYNTWLHGFTGIEMYTEEYYWCFGQYWDLTDNTPEGAALRIEWMLKNGVPPNYIMQMRGKAKLCYK